jgi:hypothetical protein
MIMRVSDYMLEIVPDSVVIRKKVGVFSMISFGALVIYPVVSRLPMLGWDWYFFFNLNDPTYNLTTPNSAYPPFAGYLIATLTWLNWRNSLAFLNSLTIISVVIGTWSQGGRYGSVLLTLLSPPLWMLLWGGHPDGLILLGLLTGLIPLALIKPQLSVWSTLGNRRLFSWTAIFLLVTFLVWPAWPLRMTQATLHHEAAFGWVEIGWPVAVIGVAMLLGAGTNAFRLMAAGMLISPYLMPYNLAILLPVIGNMRGNRKLLLWLSTWLLPLGVGLGGWGKYLNLIFLVTAYWGNYSINDYWSRLKAVIYEGTMVARWVKKAWGGLGLSSE